jgi:hypothetical protein
VVFHSCRQNERSATIRFGTIPQGLARLKVYALTVAPRGPHISGSEPHRSPKTRWQSLAFQLGTDIAIHDCVFGYSVLANTGQVGKCPQPMLVQEVDSRLLKPEVHKGGCSNQTPTGVSGSFEGKKVVTGLFTRSYGLGLQVICLHCMFERKPCTAARNI